MRFQVPQFIEVESKLFGPLTMKQFVYLVGGAGSLFLLYISPLPSFIALLIGLPIGGLALALAFQKVNGQPFIKVVENAIAYAISSKLYIWKKEEKKMKIESIDDLNKRTKEAIQPKDPLGVPKLTKSKLKDLAWSLDIKKETR